MHNNKISLLLLADTLYINMCHRVLLVVRGSMACTELHNGNEATPSDQGRQADMKSADM